MNIQSNEARLTRIEAWREALQDDIGRDREEAKTYRMDVEQRLRRLERALYTGFGGLAVLQLVFKFLIK